MSTSQTREPHPAEGGRTAGRTQHEPSNAWQLVAAREMAVKLRDRNFLASTLVTMLLLVGVLGFNAVMAGGTDTTRVAVVTAEGKALAEAAGRVMHQADDKTGIEVVQATDQADAEAKVTAEDADLLLVQRDQGWELAGKDTPSDRVPAYVRDVVQGQVLARTAAKAGTTPEALAAQTQVTTRALSGTDDSEGLAVMIANFAFATLFYMAALMFGMQIAQSVIEEKQSRIVEILASAIPVRQLLAGKVIGNTVMAVGQIVLYLAVGLIGLSFTPYKSLLTSMATGMVWYAFFFLAGFLALACIWAVAGSLATRNEDLQQTTTPLTMLLVAGFFGAMAAQGTVKVVLSFVPVLSSMVMPGRLMEGSASWWEGLLALALTLAFAAWTVRVGERMYRRSLMQTSSRMTFRQALRAQD